MLEIAVFTPSSALKAAQSGAHRLELCTSYPLGGLTPSLPMLQNIHLTLSTLSINLPIVIMIRPRGGDFTYTASEYATMKAEIERFKQEPGVSGFVFGILTAKNEIDERRNAELVSLAAPLPCTFHRAIDLVAATERVEALESVVQCGFERVLSSGGEETAWEGRGGIRELKRVARGRVDVIAGGGVRNGNLGALRREVGGGWVHSAAILDHEGGKEEVDGEEVRRLVEGLREG